MVYACYLIIGIHLYLADGIRFLVCYKEYTQVGKTAGTVYVEVNSEGLWRCYIYVWLFRPLSQK